jgi:uncharacterized protein (DUF342 family)
MTKGWFAHQFLKHGLSKSMFISQLQDLADAVKIQEDLTGSVIAIGEEAIRGESPYIFDSLKDGENEEIDYENDVVDIRGLQQKNLASSGVLIAEIKFLEEAQNGVDVFGKIIYPKLPDEFNVQVGEGVEQRDGGKFYASFDGVVKIEGQSISLAKIMIHQGDVNLRSGNISFDGPVEIRGSIDTGSVVEAAGDITVFGNIRGAVVKSGGAIFVKGGIVTGDQGRIEAKDNIKAEFIENSNIHCEGSIVAQKAIINTTAIVGGSIEVLSSDNGILAGGYLTCKHNIRTGELGFKRGALTKLKVGVDWKIEKAVFIRTTRLEKVAEVQQRDRLEVRELAGKRKAQMTRKHVERKEELMKRVRKARSIIEKLEKQLIKYRAQLSFNMESVVFVSATLSSNVEMNIGGLDVNIPHDLAGVGISAKKRRGSHILPYEEAERFVVKMTKNAS